MNYVERLKIKPNKELEYRLNQLCNINRFIYNWVLSQTLQLEKRPTKRDIQIIRDLFRKNVRERTICDKNNKVLSNEFIDLLSSTPSQISDLVVDDLYRAWQTVTFPKKPSFRKKFSSKSSFSIHKKTSYTFKLDDNILKVSSLNFKLPLTKLRFLNNKDQIKRISITKTSYGWYINILIDIDDGIFKIMNKPTGKKVGIDWGIKNFISDSDGFQVSFKDLMNMTRYKKLESRIKDLQRILSKKRVSNPEWKKSKKYLKLKNKIALMHEKMKNMRKNAIHEISKHYSTYYDEVSIENLKIKGLLKNHKLAKSLSESMFYTWKITLKYKLERAGKILHLKDPRDTSQTCSCCGKKATTKLSLNVRTFKCEFCSYVEDRDINAAKNILAK